MKHAAADIQYAVPQTLEKRLEILRAMRALTAQDDETLRQRRTGTASLRRELEEIRREVRKFSREWPSLVRSDLRKAGFDPNEPRVPAGNPDGGQWTTENGVNSPTDRQVTFDARPDNNAVPGAQYAVNDPPGISHNQGSPPEEPPEIPPDQPATRQAINAFLKAAAYWLAEAAEAPAAEFILALEAAEWLSHGLAYIYAYLDSPKTLEELQQDALSPKVGYNIHHIVEQTSAEQDGFPDSMIDGSDNLVRIPTLTHWLISAWYSRSNDQFDGLSPREYLRGKSWDERMQVGEYALILYGVLQP